VEHYRRANGTHYFVAYPDDFVQTVTMHDRPGRLRPRSIRQTFEIVFAYNRSDGTLETYAKMPAPLKARLETLFGQIILEVDLGPQCRCRPYDLNRLKDRYFCLQTDPADGLTAAITLLRIETPTWGRISLEPAQNGYVRDVYEMAYECLNGETVCWDDVDILKARFRFRFDPRRGRRAGTLHFQVSYPDHCVVETRRPERIELVRKYLKRWRIAHV